MLDACDDADCEATPVGAPERRKCSFYLRTGTCAYGSHCRFFHPEVRPQAQLNSSGLPLRPGEPACSFFLRRGVCAFGLTCKFHHPELDARWDGGDRGSEPPPEQPPPQAQGRAPPASPGPAAPVAPVAAAPPLHAAAMVVPAQQLVYYVPGVSVFPVPPVMWYTRPAGGMPMGATSALWSPPQAPQPAYAAGPSHAAAPVQLGRQASPTRRAQDSSGSQGGFSESGTTPSMAPRMQRGADSKASTSVGSEGLDEQLRGLTLRTSFDQLPGADQQPSSRAEPQEPQEHRRTLSAPLPAGAVTEHPHPHPQPQLQRQQRQPSQRQEPCWRQRQGYGN